MIRFVLGVISVGRKSDFVDSKLLIVCVYFMLLCLLVIALLLLCFICHFVKHFMLCLCQVLQVNKSPVDKMSSDCLINSLRSAVLLELTVRFNMKGIFLTSLFDVPCRGDIID